MNRNLANLNGPAADFVVAIGPPLAPVPTKEAVLLARQS